MSSPSTASTGVEFKSKDYGKCYSSRDEFFSCAEAYERNLQASECADKKKAYDEACMGSWRKYWNDRFSRGMEIRGPGFSN
jgi:Cytochrome oxidase c subunit VIb